MPTRMRLRCATITTQHIPVWIGAWSKNPKKNPWPGLFVRGRRANWENAFWANGCDREKNWIGRLRNGLRYPASAFSSVRTTATIAVVQSFQRGFAMASSILSGMTDLPQEQTPPEAVPPLENGDRLTRAEFERRYRAMPHLKKAELIEGVVYIPSPVR